MSQTVFGKIKSVGCSKTLGKIGGIEDDDEYENDTPA
jgi:hypothetical protein